MRSFCLILPRRWRKLWQAAGGALAVYLGLVVLGMILENQLIYYPARYPEGNWHPFGLNQQDVYFQAEDGTRLHGWYVPHPDPQAHVLFCHGNAGNITHRDFILESLRDLVGVAVFIFDYRGYGRSQGRPSEPGLLADGRAARRWLARHARIPENRVVLLGESIGSAVAVDLAADGGARGLILEGAFSSLPEVAAYHFPWLPVRWMMRTKLNNLEKIRRYRGPLLQSHGDCDRTVPYDLGLRLFQAANQPKQFITIPGGDHNDPRSREYYEKMRAFVQKTGQPGP